MNQQQLDNKYQIFCDLDGVLVDLIKGVENAIYTDPIGDVSDRYRQAQEKARQELKGKPLDESQLNKKHENFSKPLRDFMFRIMNGDRHFWMNLPWTKDGKELWYFIKEYNPIILSKPTDLQSVIGKKVWVKRNLDLNKERVQIRKDKTPYAQHNGKIGLLIDDYRKNIVAFGENGGATIHYKDVNEAIATLKEFGFSANTH